MWRPGAAATEAARAAYGGSPPRRGSTGGEGRAGVATPRSPPQAARRVKLAEKTTENHGCVICVR